MNGYQQTAYGDLSLMRRSVQAIAVNTESIAKSLKILADAAAKVDATPPHPSKP